MSTNEVTLTLVMFKRFTNRFINSSRSTPKTTVQKTTSNVLVAVTRNDTSTTSNKDGLASLMMTVPAGSRYENSNSIGSAHFLKNCSFLVFLVPFYYFNF